MFKILPKTHPSRMAKVEAGQDQRRLACQTLTGIPDRYHPSVQWLRTETRYIETMVSA